MYTILQNNSVNPGIKVKVKVMVKVKVLFQANPAHTTLPPDGICTFFRHLISFGSITPLLL